MRGQNRRKRIIRPQVRHMRLTDKELFLLNVDASAGANGCWYIGDNKGPGYSYVTYHGKKRPAHNVSLEVAFDETVPPGMVVCHVCDNPPCCNPNHLVVGTHKDNSDDKIAKGRWRGGAKAKVVESDLPDIIQRRESRESIRTIAQSYGVSESAIHRAFEKSKIFNKPNFPLLNAGGRKMVLTENQIQKAILLLKNPAVGYAEVASKFRVARSTIYRSVRAALSPDGYAALMKNRQKRMGIEK